MEIIIYLRICTSVMIKMRCTGFFGKKSKKQRQICQHMIAIPTARLYNLSRLTPSITITTPFQTTIPNTKRAAQIRRYADTCNNLVEVHAPPAREKTPPDMIAIVEMCLEELGHNDNDNDERMTTMTEAAKYEEIYRRLLFTGKFSPISAANAIFDFKEGRKEKGESKASSQSMTDSTD